MRSGDTFVNLLLSFVGFWAGYGVRACIANRHFLKYHPEPEEKCEACD